MMKYFCVLVPGYTTEPGDLSTYLLPQSLITPYLSILQKAPRAVVFTETLTPVIYETRLLWSAQRGFSSSHTTV